MAVFTQDIINEEEKLSGFGPEDEDIFKLDSLEKYPGEIPEYNQMTAQAELAVAPAADDGFTVVPETAIEPETPFEEAISVNEEIIDAVQSDIKTNDDDLMSAFASSAFGNEEPETLGADKFDIDEFDFLQTKKSAEETDESVPAIKSGDDNVFATPTSGSVWDLFDQPDETPATQPIEEETVPTVIETPQQEEFSFATTPIQREEVPAPTVTPIPVKEEISPDDSFNLTMDDSVALDDDFQKMLAEELEKSKLKKAQEPVKEEIKPKGFVPVDNLKETITIDLNNFDLGHPSSPETSQTQPMFNLNVNEEVPTKETLKQKKSKAEKVKVVKEKKERKPFPWITVATIAAILIIVGGLGFGGYYLYENYEIDKDAILALIYPAKSEDDSAKTATDEKIAEKSEHKEAVKGEEIKADTAKKTVDTVKTAKEEPKIEEKNKEEIKDKVKGKIPETIKLPLEKPKKEIVEKHKKTKDAAEKHSIAKKDSGKKTKKDKSDLASTKKINKKDLKSSSSESGLKFGKDEKGVYVVQVYSSPSKEDAEDWLNKLKAKNIRSAYISSYKWRDQTWYRVRFGDFSTKSEAKAVSIKYGFSQSWIDRIK